MSKCQRLECIKIMMENLRFHDNKTNDIEIWNGINGKRMKMKNKMNFNVIYIAKMVHFQSPIGNQTQQLHAYYVSVCWTNSTLSKCWHSPFTEKLPITIIAWIVFRSVAIFFFRKSATSFYIEKVFFLFFGFPLRFIHQRVETHFDCFIHIEIGDSCK